MSLQKWKDWFEFVALLGVLASLVALVYELRQTQNSMQAETYQARAFNGIEWNFTLVSNPELLEMQARLDDGLPALKGMTGDEIEIAKRLMTIVRIDLDNEHFQYQSGLLDPGFYFGETIFWIKEAAPLWRELNGLEPRPEFREEVDRILADDSIVTRDEKE